MLCRWLLLLQSWILQQRLVSLHSLKYFLSGPLLKKKNKKKAETLPTSDPGKEHCLTMETKVTQPLFLFFALLLCFRKCISFATILIKSHEDEIRKTSSGKRHIRSDLNTMHIWLKITCIATLYNEFSTTVLQIFRISFRIIYMYWKQKNTKFFLSKKKAHDPFKFLAFRITYFPLMKKKSTQILVLSSSIPLQKHFPSEICDMCPTKGDHTFKK